MPRSLLELRHLRMLAILAETGSVSQTARQLHLTQSAVSHQLRALSAHYGIPFVKREGQSVVLTEPGLRLVTVARTVAQEILQAERDLSKLSNRPKGALRIALECHTCFDWLMPVMDRFRKSWPGVELDLVSGFHADSLALLRKGRADVVVVSEQRKQRGIVYRPLFRFEILAVLSPEHRLRNRRVLHAADFAGETLITYPVAENRIDVIERVLKPAGIRFQRRTAELTIAILQLVASNRGIAALPEWGIRNYVEYDYVAARRIGKKGLWSELYLATTVPLAAEPYVGDFVETIKSTCFSKFRGLIAI